VFRVADLDKGQFGVNVFDSRQETIDLIRSAMEADFAGSELVRLSLDPPQREIKRLRVSFVTPAELKGASQPEFGVLFARIRDRVSTLRAFYGTGPLAIDFAAMGRRAARALMTRCDLRWVDEERTSRHTGQRHPLGGFVGVAEYQGDLAEFVPYLEAARWTGAGRQTVWGKGEIHCEEI